MSKERLREGALYTTVLVAALLWRIPSLGEGFWIDEVMSAETIRDPWGLMFTRTGFTDVHPPGYYALLKIWSALLGGSDLALRALSLCAGLGTAALVVRWIRGSAGRLAALFGGLTLSVSLFHIHYSVEVRAYAMFTFVALLLAWCVRRWIAHPTSRMLGWIALLEVAALSLHYYALLWVALLNVYVFTHASLTREAAQRSVRMRWLQTQLCSLAVFAAWLPMLFVQLFELPEVMKAHLSDDLPLARVLASLGPLPSVDAAPLAVGAGCGVLVLAVLGAWTLHSRGDTPPPATASMPEKGSPLRWVLGLAIALLFAPLVPLVAMPMSDALVEAYLRQLPWAYATILGVVVLGGVAMMMDRMRLEVPLPTLLAVGGPALVVGLTQVQPMLFLRNLLVFVPPVLLLAAFAVDRAPRAAQIAACLVMMGLAASHVGSGSEAFMPRQDFAEAATALDAAPEDSVVVAPGWDALGITRYRPKRSVVEAMNTRDIAEASSKANSLVVLLSRPSRHEMSSADVEGALQGVWRLEDTRLFRGHRGAMQWRRYIRGDGG